MDLDAQYEPHISDDEEDDNLARELKRKVTKHGPDDQFVPVHIGKDFERVIMIESELSEEVKAALVKCLKNYYTDLFAWNAADMPGISPDIACHHLSSTQRRHISCDRLSRSI